MYLRLVIAEVDSDSQSRLGLIQVAYDVYDRLKEGDPNHPDLVYLRDHLVWLEEELRVPARFRARRGPQTAICWFKDTADEHIKLMFEMRRILREHGIESDVISTKRPGRIVYEDAHQIAAVPFSDTGT